MTYSSKLLASQSLKDWPGSKGIASDVVDEIVEKEQRRIMKRRTLCTVCMSYRSTSGSCFC
jgi:hypothetical protein